MIENSSWCLQPTIEAGGIVSLPSPGQRHSPGRSGTSGAAGLDRLALYEALQPVEIAVALPGICAQMSEIKVCHSPSPALARALLGV